jgi:hypothetical protein
MTGLCHTDAMSEPTSQDQYLAFTTQPVTIGGETFYARVHWARVGGQVQVVGMDLRTFFSEAENTAAAEALEGDVRHDDPWPRLTTTVLRGLRFAEVAEESRQTLLRSLNAAPAPPEAERASRGRTRKAVERPANESRRGPAPLLTTDDLRLVVAPAYLNGGIRPVEDVQQALKGVRSMGRHVTKEQARKAVAKARALGFIPPYDRRTR